LAIPNIPVVAVQTEALTITVAAGADHQPGQLRTEPLPPSTLAPRHQAAVATVVTPIRLTLGAMALPGQHQAGLAVVHIEDLALFRILAAVALMARLLLLILLLLLAIC
jgi:hypothetical protein